MSNIDIDYLRTLAENATDNSYVKNSEYMAAFNPSTMTDLLDELEKMRSTWVPMNWEGLCKILDEIYPEDIFPTLADDPSRDTGPRIISLTRRLMAAESKTISTVGELSLRHIGQRIRATWPRIEIEGEVISEGGFDERTITATWLSAFCEMLEGFPEPYLDMFLSLPCTVLDDDSE